MIYQGDKPITDIKLGDVDITKVYLGDRLVWERNVSPIPSGYSPKEYIKSVYDVSHEGQFIKTDITAPCPTIVMDVEINSVDGWNFMCGKWYGNSNAYSFSNDRWGASGYNFWSGSFRGATVVGTPLTTGVRYTITMTPSRMSWTTADGTGNGYIDNTSGTECTNSTMPILLFNMSVTGAWDYSTQYLDGFCIPVSAYGDMTMYSCIISDTATGVELGHFVPCTRDADSVVGLYDTVSDTFYRSYLYTRSGDFV